MNLTLRNLLAMTWRSITNAQEGAEEVLALGVPRQALWLSLATVVVISTVISQAQSVFFQSLGAELPDGLLGNTLAMGAILFVILAITAYAIWIIGGFFGGKGSLEEALLLVAWLQFIMIVVQLAQLVAMLLLPPLAALILLAGFILFFWLLTNFVAVVHRFQSRALVFLMIIVSAFVLAFLAGIVLSIIGVDLSSMMVVPE